MTIRNAVVGVVLCACVALAEPPAPIAGEYVEARSNHVYTCGCLYSGEMVTDGREAILIWNFQRGVYQGASLESVKVMAVVTGQDALSLGAGNRRAVLYVDRAASLSQRDAVVALLAARYAPVLGEIAAVHAVPIGFDKEAGTVTVRAAGIAEVSMRAARLPDDAHLGSVLWYSPFIPLADSTLAMTLRYEYSGNDLASRWWRNEPGITGYFGRFTVSP